MTRWLRVAAGIASGWLVGTAVPATAQTGSRVSVLMRETLWCSVTPCATTQLFTVAPDQGGLVASDVFSNSSGTGQMWVSPDGAFQVWLTQTLQGQIPAYSLLVRAVTDGSVLRIPVASAAPSFVGSPVELEVYLSDFASPYALSRTLMRADVDAGTTSSVVLTGLPAEPRAFLNPLAAELFVVDGDALTVFDPDTLQVLKSVARRAAPPYWGVGFDETRPWMYVLDINGVNIVRSTFSIIDTLTLQTIGSGDLPSDSFPRSIVVASPPRPPMSLGALVNGGQVSLSWSVGGPPATVNRYVLDVGCAPGLSDIFTGLDVGLQTLFAASGVPPRRYYVRVRAGNYTGLSAPSNEVVVQGP